MHNFMKEALFLLHVFFYKKCIENGLQEKSMITEKRATFQMVVSFRSTASARVSYRSYEQKF